MDGKAMTLTDILGRDYIQEIQDNISAATGFSIIACCPDGKALTRPSGWSFFCENFNAHDLKQGLCAEHMADLIIMSRAQGTTVFEACPHTGLAAAAVPLLHEGRYLGAWVITQLLFEDHAQALVGEIAERNGLSEDAVAAMLGAIPVTTPEAFEKLHAFLQTLNLTLISMVESRFALTRTEKELRGMAEQMLVSSKLVQSFIDNSHVGLYVSDYYTGEILVVNNTFCSQVGMNSEEVVGKKCWEVNGMATEGFCRFCPRERLLDESNSPAPPYTWAYYNMRYGKWLRCTNQVVHWTHGRLAHMVRQLDFTKEKEMRDELERLAYYSRTGLPNGEKLIVDIKAAVAQQGAGAYGGSFLSLPSLGSLRRLIGGKNGAGAGMNLVCFDVSSLRIFNDTYGRDTGGKLLDAIVRWCLEQKFPRAALYHVDTYEFCFLLNESDEGQARRLARDLADRFTKPWYVELDGRDISYYCTAHFSVFSLTRDKLVERDLLGLISRSLDSARKTRQLFILDEDRFREAHERAELELKLKDCVNRGMQGFAVHYQPIVEMPGKTWKGLEALCRWECPGIGRVPPDQFIPEAEQLGLISTIGAWVLEEAVGCCKTLGLDGHDGFFLSVNLSPIQIMDDSLSDTVADILSRHDYPGGKLNLEVTESAEIAFNSLTSLAIEKLRALGVTLALDDFGTGYSSFNSLKNLPVQYVKTERVFIEGIEDNSYMQYFFFVMAELSHANGKKLIAEGIENESQLAVIKNNGADFIQGYYFSRPLPGAELRERLANFTRVGPDPAPARAEPVDINQWLNGKNAYVLTPNLLKLINQSMQYLLAESSFDAAIRGVMGIAGEHFCLARSFLWERQEDRPGGGRIIQWTSGAGTVRPLLHPDQTAPQCMRMLKDIFASEGMLITSDLGATLKDNAGIAWRTGVGRLVLMPVWDGDDLAGVVGFENEEARDWSPEEIVMLWNLSMAVAGTVKKEHLKMQVDIKSTLLTSVLNHSVLNVVVSDFETDEILWINDTIKTRYKKKDSDFLGRKCHEVFQGRSSRCPCCRVPEMAADPERKPLTFEVNNTHLDKAFIVYSSLLQWEDGRDVHVEYTIDVTEHKRIERQMEFFASMDRLTGVMNRSAFLLRAGEQLERSRAFAKPVSFALIDVDGLREHNTRHGYKHGDQVLCNIAMALRSCIRKGDSVGRIGGDEFMVMFPGCGKGMAQVRIMQARRLLAQIDMPEGRRSPTFKFAVVEDWELQTDDTDLFFSELGNTAERRMQEEAGVPRRREEDAAALALRQ